MHLTFLENLILLTNMNFGWDSLTEKVVLAYNEIRVTYFNTLQTWNEGLEHQRPHRLSAKQVHMEF